SPEESCLVEIRSLIYAVEGKRDTDAENVRLAWQRLRQMRCQVVVGCLSEVQRALLEGDYQLNKVDAYPPVELVASYPEDCLAVSRRFVDESIDSQFYPEGPEKEQGVTFDIKTD